jgi:hypothetical protein
MGVCVSAHAIRVHAHSLVEFILEQTFPQLSLAAIQFGARPSIDDAVSPLANTEKENHVVKSITTIPQKTFFMVDSEKVNTLYIV